MPEELKLLIALLLTAGPPVLVCLVIPGSGLVVLFVGLLLAGHFQWQGLKSILKKAKPVAIRDLSPQMKLVRISGKITQTGEVLDAQDPALVMLKVQINGWRYAGGRHEYGGVWGKTKASPLRLDDGRGSMWIDPRPLDPRLLGEGTKVDYETMRKTCQILEKDIDQVIGGVSQIEYLVWEWRVGQQLTVIGNLQQENGEWKITRLKGQPMLVSHLEFDQLSERVLKTGSRVQGLSWGVIVLITLMIGCPVLAFGGWLLSILLSQGK